MKNKQLFCPYKKFIGAVVPNSIMRNRNLSHLAKLCLARLFQYAGKRDYCFPSHNSLCYELAVSVSQLKRAIKELKDIELVIVEKPKGDERKKHKTCIYKFLWNEEVYCEKTKELVTVEFQ